MRIKINSIKAQTDDTGTVQIVATVSPASKWSAKEVVKDCRKWLESDEEIQCVLSRIKKPRTLPQNALLWKLLTIYADETNGGKTGGETPENIYYRMLSKYGVAEYIAIPEDAVEDLRRVYRDIKVIDDTVIERNGRRTPAKMVKCIVGSSHYETKEMAHLIDGVFDELATMGVDYHGEEIAELFTDWRLNNGQHF